MTTITHTPECLALQEKSRIEQARWDARFPDYCRRCQGFGVVWDGGDPDVGIWAHYEPCGCLDSMQCPRCKGRLSWQWSPAFACQDFDMLYCGACGWCENDDEPSGGRPELFAPSPNPEPYTDYCLCDCPDFIWAYNAEVARLELDPFAGG